MKIVISILLFFSAANSYSQPPLLPSDTDLKAGYCLGVFKETNVDGLENYAKTQPPEKAKPILKWATSRRADILKVQGYLFPRLESLDVQGIELAMLNGTAEAKRAGDESVECIKACPYDGGELNACQNACINNKTPLMKRTQSCNDLSWLPY